MSASVIRGKYARIVYEREKSVAFLFSSFLRQRLYFAGTWVEVELVDSCELVLAQCRRKHCRCR